MEKGPQPKKKTKPLDPEVLNTPERQFTLRPSTEAAVSRTRALAGSISPGSQLKHSACSYVLDYSEYVQHGFHDFDDDDDDDDWRHDQPEY